MEKEFAKWSVQRAIQEQVEREATYRWAVKKEEVQELPEMPEWCEKVKHLGHGFPLQMVRYLMP